MQLQGALAAAASASGPTPSANVYIQAPSGATVGGPALATSINSLTLGLFSGSLNELDLSNAGRLTITGPAGATVNPSGYLNLGGGTLSTTALTIAGSASAGSGSSLTVSGTLASSGTANFAAGSNLSLANVLVSGGQFTTAGGGSIPNLTVSGGTTTLGGTINVTTLVPAGSAIFNASGGTIGSVSLAGGYTGTTTIGAAATVTSATVSNGTLALNNSSMASLTVSGGSVNIGPALTAASVVIDNTGSTSASVNTGANFLTVTGTLNVLNPATTIAISGSSFAVKAASLGSNIDTLRLSGGTTTLNYQTSAASQPGLDIRAWQSGTSAASLDTYTGGAAANPPNVSYDPRTAGRQDRHLRSEHLCRHAQSHEPRRRHQHQSYGAPNGSKTTGWARGRSPRPPVTSITTPPSTAASCTSPPPAPITSPPPATTAARCGSIRAPITRPTPMPTSRTITRRG